MTQRLIWHDEWSLDIDDVDADHRGLVECFAAICERFGPDASRRRTGDGTALIGLLTDLGEAAREHFEREEALMHEIGYADLAEHRTEHALLMAEYADMLRRWCVEPLLALDEAKQEVIRDWILDHILGADRDFAKSFHAMDETLATRVRRPSFVSPRIFSSVRRGL